MTTAFMLLKCRWPSSKHNKTRIEAKDQETTDATLEGVTGTIAPNHETMVATKVATKLEADTAPHTQIAGDMKADILHMTAATHETTTTTRTTSTTTRTTATRTTATRTVTTVIRATVPDIEAKAHAIPIGPIRAAGTTEMIPRLQTRLPGFSYGRTTRVEHAHREILVHEACKY